MSKTLGDLMDALFAQIDRLADAGDAEAVDIEVRRATAMKGLSEAVVANARTAMDAVRLGGEMANGKVAVIDPALRLTGAPSAEGGDGHAKRP